MKKTFRSMKRDSSRKEAAAFFEQLIKAAKEAGANLAFCEALVAEPALFKKVVGMVERHCRKQRKKLNKSNKSRRQQFSRSRSLPYTTGPAAQTPSPPTRMGGVPIQQFLNEQAVINW